MSLNYVKASKPTQAHKTSEKEIKNSCGAYVFKVSDKTLVERFCLMGTESGTYYVTERDLTVATSQKLINLIKQNAKLVFDTMYDISVNGRNYKQNPVIYTYALICTYGDLETRKLAYKALPEICRTGTMLMMFQSYVKELKGSSKGLRKAISSWYLSKSRDQLDYQCVKYRNREGFTHRDVLRLNHVKPMYEGQHQLFKYLVGKGEAPTGSLLEIMESFKNHDKVTKPMLDAIIERGLPHEALPTGVLKSDLVWKAMLPTMGVTALVRNLARFSSLGMTEPFSESEKMIVSRLQDVDGIKKSKIHPMNILTASIGYQKGSNRNMTWNVSSKVVEALNTAFELSFINVEKTDKNVLLAIDVSASMSSNNCIGNQDLTVLQAAAAMALVTYKSNPNTRCIGFDTQLRDIPMYSNDTISSVYTRLHNFMGGGTDCSIPMRYLLSLKEKSVDSLVIFTDNETNRLNRLKPMDVMKEYNKGRKDPAKLVVNAMAMNDFSIADDSGLCLDVCGFDSNSPRAIADFIR